MKKHIKLWCLAFLTMGLWTIQGCSKDKNDNGPGGELLEIEYKPGAVVIDKPAQEVIVSVNEDQQVYTLKKSAFEHTPQVGEVILVPGEMLRKVRSISTSGNNLIVETEDAAVTDVIENGSFSYDITPEWSDVTSLMMGGKELLVNGSMSGPEAIEAEISHGGVTHKMKITPTMSNGRISSCTFVLQMVKKNKTVFTATGTATLPNQKTDIVIQNGKLKTFKSNNNGIKADFKVEMATAGGESGNHNLKMPKVLISVPIRVIPGPAGPIPNPIPMSLDIGVHFVSQMTIPDPLSSATGKTSISFDANSGFEFKSATVEAVGAFARHELQDGTFDSAANLGMPIDLQFGIGFPRVSLNIAGQEVAYVHMGYTTGSKLTWGPLCKSGYSKLVVEGGYSLKVLGQTLFSEQKTFAEYEKRADNDC